MEVTDMTERNQSIQNVEPAAPAAEAVERPVFVPAADIYEREQELILTVDLPGVKNDQVELNLEDNVLTIRASALPDEVPGHELLYRGYEAGDFERSFTLSAEVDQDRIQAQLKNGVLRLVLPKAREAQPRKIPVQGVA
jgi:HSP20 family protein